MKKLMFVMAMAAAMTASAELKIGTVDLMLLVRNHPDYDRNKTLVESTDKDYQKKLDAIKAEGEKEQAEGKKLMEQFRNPMLAEKAKGEIEKKLQEIQQKLIGIEQRYRSESMRTSQELRDLEGRLLKATTEDLRKRIDAYALSNNYDFVLDRNAAPYSKKSFEITDAILKDMGVDPTKAKGRDESK